MIKYFKEIKFSLDLSFIAVLLLYRSFLRSHQK